MEEIEPISPAEKAEQEARDAQSAREAILTFCRDFGISHTRFAHVYGCSKSYMSQMLSGARNPNHSVMVLAFHRFGYMPKQDIKSGVWSFDKMEETVFL
mgnify:CR=1 FL=1